MIKAAARAAFSSCNNYQEFYVFCIANRIKTVYIYLKILATEIIGEKGIRQFRSVCMPFCGYFLTKCTNM